MKKTILFSTLLCSSLVLTACSSKEVTNSNNTNNSSNNSQSTTKEVVSAYDFSVMDNEGKTVKLSDFKGKKVYINVWTSWCGPCLREIPELEKTYKKLKDREDFVFLSLTSPKDEIFKNQHPSDQNKDTILAKANELGVTYPVLFDVNDRFMINYAIRSFPTHIFINSDGTIANRVAGAFNAETLEKEINNLK